jgi:2-haloacid dehalogenase
MEIAMRLHGIPYSPSDGGALVAAVPAFGPFPEVPGAPQAAAMS